MTRHRDPAHDLFRIAISNFSHRKRVPLPWTHGIEVLSSPEFLPKGTMSLQFAGGRITINLLISSGFSS
jgi:hypothetical protein